jgi:hypothetical protein
VTLAGHRPETVVLLPYLPRDLEDLAEEDALLELRGRSREVAQRVLAVEPNLPLGLRRRALERFRNKTKHARLRIKEVGWDAACHELFVETLGLGGNRAPMSELARSHSPEQMLILGLDALYMEKCGRWRLSSIGAVPNGGRASASGPPPCPPRRSCPREGGSSTTSSPACSPTDARTPCA